jgi:hypothetical protein
MFVTVLVIGEQKQFFVTLTLTNNYQHKSLIIGVELKNSTVEAHHSLSFYKTNLLETSSLKENQCAKAHRNNSQLAKLARNIKDIITLVRN